MPKTILQLQHSESVVAQSASSIFAAYIIAGRVPEGKEQEWMERAVREALFIARLADDSIMSDAELG